MANRKQQAVSYGLVVIIACSILACVISAQKKSQFALTIDRITSPEAHGLLAERSRAHLAPGTACDSYPAVGLLVRRENQKPHCTGTVIAPRIVLTAAHCLVGIAPERSLSFIDANRKTFNVISWERHPQYKPGRLGGADIALLELDGEPNVSFMPYRQEGLPAGYSGVLSFVGYGYSEENGIGGTGIKRCSSMSVDAIREFDFTYRVPKFGVCHGDSGGPALQSSSNGTRIAGITSWGESDCKTSATSVNIGAYYDWIRTTSERIEDSRRITNCDSYKSCLAKCSKEPCKWECATRVRDARESNRWRGPVECNIPEGIGASECKEHRITNCTVYCGCIRSCAKGDPGLGCRNGCNGMKNHVVTHVPECWLDPDHVIDERNGDVNCGC